MFGIRSELFAGVQHADGRLFESHRSRARKHALEEGKGRRRERDEREREREREREKETRNKEKKEVKRNKLRWRRRLECPKEELLMWVSE